MRPWFRARILPAAAAAFGLLAALPAWSIVGGTATTEFGQVGRGVQVLPNWVITAHHLGYGVGSTFSNGYGSAVVAATYSFTNAAFPSDDLTLLRLATPIAAPSLSLLDTVLAAGSGYALDVTLTTGLNQVPRGYGFSQVREFLPQVDPDDGGPQAPVSANLLVTYTGNYGGPYVQGGDSGGGLFLGHVTSLAGGAPLWGIASAQLSDQDASGNDVHFRSGYTQLGSYRSWLDATLAADATDTQALAWVSSPVPEPATAALLLAGLAAVCGKARRRR